MDYLKALRDDPDLAEEFDSLFDFFLLDELSPRDEADGRATFTLPGMAFARDGPGGEYHLLEDGSIGYYSSEGEAGRLAESMDDLFSLIVSCICWHDCCDAKEYVDSKTLEEYGQRQRNINLEDMDMDSWQRVADALGIPTDEPLAPVLERFRKATQRQPLYQCIFHEDDGSLTESYGVADGLFCREIDGLFCRSSPDIIVRRRCVLSHKRRGWLQPSPSFRYSRNLALQDELYHPVINNGPAVLVCVDKRLGTGPVNQSRDAG